MTAPGVPGAGPRLVEVTSAGDKTRVRTVRMNDSDLAGIATGVSRRREMLLGAAGVLTAVVDGAVSRTWRLT